MPDKIDRSPFGGATDSFGALQADAPGIVVPLAIAVPPVSTPSRDESSPATRSKAHHRSKCRPQVAPIDRDDFRSSAAIRDAGCRAR